jgi:hypothetical protein
LAIVVVEEAQGFPRSNDDRSLELTPRDRSSIEPTCRTPSGWLFAIAPGHSMLPFGFFAESICRIGEYCSPERSFSSAPDPAFSDLAFSGVHIHK